MYASIYKHYKVAKLLLSKGAEFNIQDVDGDDAYNLTHSSQIRELIEEYITEQYRGVERFFNSPRNDPALIDYTINFLCT
jgi:hypothetical protein